MVNQFIIEYDRKEREPPPCEFCASPNTQIYVDDSYFFTFCCTKQQDEQMKCCNSGLPSYGDFGMCKRCIDILEDCDE